MNKESRVANRAASSERWRLRRLVGRSRPLRLAVMRRSGHMKRWLLRHPWTRPMLAMSLAACKVQALIRGFLARCRVRQLRAAASGKRRSKPARQRRRGGGRGGGGARQQLEKYLACLEYYKTQPQNKSPAWIHSGYSIWCAVRIQSWWRMLRVKHRLRYMLRGMFYQIASLDIQSAWRAHWSRRLYNNAVSLDARHGRGMVVMMPVKKRNPLVEAAHRIQGLWRRYCFKKIYRYFKDLVLNKLKGTPSELLRNIIPGETELLDKAAGAHVRFRLGGAIFPPMIYFKIYTHRPLCDVNAFAPRDYTKEATKVNPLQVHNKLESAMKAGTLHPVYSSIRVGAKYFNAKITTTNVSGEGWYRRGDFNNWRPISTLALNEAFTTSGAIQRDDIPFGVTRPEDKTAKPFHYSRLVRTIDIVRDRKRRRREWMVKSYLLSAVSKEQASRRRDPALADLAATREALAARIDEHERGPAQISYPRVIEARSMDQDAIYDQVLQEYEAKQRGTKGDFIDEELLRWSMQLDYETYNKEWAGIGISLPTDF